MLSAAKRCDVQVSEPSWRELFKAGKPQTVIGAAEISPLLIARSG
jgi:hypothetical protein